MLKQHSKIGDVCKCRDAVDMARRCRHKVIKHQESLGLTTRRNGEREVPLLNSKDETREDIVRERDLDVGKASSACVAGAYIVTSKQTVHDKTRKKGMLSRRSVGKDDRQTTDDKYDDCRCQRTNPFCLPHSAHFLTLFRN